MVEPSQDREGEDLATCMLCRQGSSFLLRNLLLDALVRSCLVKVVDIGIENPLELPLMENEQMIEAFSPDTAKEALTDSIGSRGVIRSFENLDVTCFRNSRKAHLKLAIVITDEVLRSHPKGGRFP
jgi:hypothetical protein